MALLMRQHDRNALPEPSIHHHCLIQFNTQQTKSFPICVSSQPLKLKQNKAATRIKE